MADPLETLSARLDALLNDAYDAWNDWRGTTDEAALAAMHDGLLKTGAVADPRDGGAGRHSAVNQGRAPTVIGGTMGSPLEERIAAARNPPPGEFGPFAESVRLVLEMHRHALRGPNARSHADALRDGMTAPWNAMTDEERAVVNKLSAALRRDEKIRRLTRHVGTRLVPTQVGGEGDGR